MALALSTRTTPVTFDDDDDDIDDDQKLPVFIYFLFKKSETSFRLAVAMISACLSLRNRYGLSADLGRHSSTNSPWSSHMPIHCATLRWQYRPRGRSPR